MVNPGIKLTPGGSGAKGYPLKRTIGHSALSFATFDPFLVRSRVPDSIDSESERAGASVGSLAAASSHWRLHPTVQARRARAWRLRLFLGGGSRI